MRFAAAGTVWQQRCMRDRPDECRLAAHAQPRHACHEGATQSMHSGTPDTWRGAVLEAAVERSTLLRSIPPQNTTPAQTSSAHLIVEGCRSLKMRQSTAPPASQCWKLRSCAQLMPGPSCGVQRRARRWYAHCQATFSGSAGSRTAGQARSERFFQMRIATLTRSDQVGQLRPRRAWAGPLSGAGQGRRCMLGTFCPVPANRQHELQALPTPARQLTGAAMNHQMKPAAVTAPT